MSGRPRAAAILLTLFVVGVAACTSDRKPLPQPDATTALGDAAGQTRSCDTAVGGSDVIETTVDPPSAQDAPGAGQAGETELNEGRPPPVPDEPDAKVPDLRLVPDIVESASGAQGGAEPDDLVPYQPVTTLGGADLTGTIAEPEVAIDGNRAMLGWNWQTAFSSDGGQSFTYANPFGSFTRVDGGFCCDQRVIHVPAQDLWLWVLQYIPGPTGDNTIRLASAAGDEAFDARQFNYVDWTAQDAGLPPGVWLDQTKIAASNAYLYLSVNAFTAAGKFMQPLVIRAALADIRDGGPVAATCWRATDPTTGRNLAGAIPTRGAGATMYLAAHVSTSELGVWSWPDADAGPTFHSVRDLDESGAPVRYPSAPRYTCQRPGGEATSDWCVRPSEDGDPGNDARPTSAWVASGRIGVAWNASQDAAGRPFPFVWVIVLDETKVASCETGDCVVGYPHIADGRFAIQYGSIMENAEGELGAVAIMGGGDRFPSCGALAHERDISTESGWRFLIVGASNGDLPEPASGDYLGLSLDSEGSNAWIGSCMSYTAPDEVTAGGMRVHVTRFGRNRNDLIP